MTHPERQVAEEVIESASGPVLAHYAQRDRDEVILDILERHEDGETLRAICNDPNMPSRTLLQKWINGTPGLRERFAHAREEWRHALNEQVIDIGEEASKSARSSLDIDLAKLRMWGRLQVLARADNQKDKGKALSSRVPDIHVVGIEAKKPLPSLPAPEDDDE